MSTAMPADMDSFLPLLSTTDTKMRLSVGSKLLAYLTDSSNSIVCSDIGFFVDQLVVWLQCSNYKIVQVDLDILSELIGRMKMDFHPYLPTLIPHLVDRLEDSKEVIREKASCLFLKLVECNVITLQSLFDKIAASCFSHKNSNVREQIMYLLCNVLDTYGASSLSISKLVPYVVKCLSDSNASIRSTAFDTLCNIYKHVGERVRVDLLKKNSIPANKLPALMSKFDEIKASNDGLSGVFQSLKIEDEVDQRDNQLERNSTRSVNSVFSRPPVTPSSIGVAYSAKSKLVSSNKTAPNNQAGMVDEDAFIDNFEKVPTVQIYSGRDVDECLKKYHDMLKNKNEDWENRVDCLKKIRSLILADALKYDEFYDNLNRLLPAFHSAIDDLRSMIAREACITVAFLSKNLEHKFDHFAESVLSNLINLIQKSQKVFASSGLVCVRFILQHTHAPRLIPIIANNLNSKSKDIRRACCEFIYLILQTWHTHTIERYASVVQEAIKKGIADADADARIFSRKAYSEFAQQFPEMAESLKNSLDFSYRKLLLSGSNSGSSSSLSKFASGDAKSSIPRSLNAVSLRSNSAIDLQAVKRAKTRAQYAALSRQKFGSGAPAVRPKASPIAPSVSSVTTEPRVGRTKNRISVSQPTSRSGSPSSRFSSYSHYLATTGGAVSRSRKSSIGNDTSRETSPNRSFGAGGLGYKSRVSTQPVRRPVIAQKILQQSREAETELADALGNISDLSPYSFRPASRHLFRTPDDHSDESETSSISSEHSFDLYRRASDSMSWNGSQHRLYREMGDLPLKEIGDIVCSCESTHWSERKKGLISLQYYIQEGNKLELSDLKRIMDLFLKIFNDPHIKVFSLFLDTLNELILSHSVDLCFCLHLLLTRLFNKLGTDLLNSVHSKIMKTLDNVFIIFPHDLQIQSVFRFLVDPTQTPNNRVKQAALNYIIRLTSVVDPATAFSANNHNKDYATMALTKIISWTMTDTVKTSAELRKVAQEAILALFNLNPSQVTRRFSSMPADHQETAANICKSKNSLHAANSHGDGTYNNSHSSASLNSSVEANLSSGVITSRYGSGGPSSGSKTDSLPDTNYKSFCKSLPGDVNNHVQSNELRQSFRRPAVAEFGESSTPVSDADGKANCDTSQNDSPSLKSCIDQLSQTNENLQAKHDLLLKITKLVQESSSNALISNFKPLLGKIISFMTTAEPAAIKEIVLNLLQLLVRRQTITFLLKQFSDLVITKVLALCGDSSKDVVKAAENCAIVLSTNLPAESIVRIIVPLITAEAAPVKLIAIKMLTRLVENADDDSVTSANIDQIMPVLLVAYDDIESSVRKAAVFSMVALYRQSDAMRIALEPYIAKLQGAKLKLLQLYIERAEQGL